MIRLKKTELSIGGNITNTIKPTINPINNINKNELNNQPNNISISNNNSIVNSQNNSSFFKLDKNKSNKNLSLTIESKDEEKEKEKKIVKKMKNYKTITIVSSNLVDHPSQQEKHIYTSIRRKYATNKSNDNLPLLFSRNMGIIFGMCPKALHAKLYIFGFPIRTMLACP